MKPMKVVKRLVMASIMPFPPLRRWALKALNGGRSLLYKRTMRKFPTEPTTVIFEAFGGRSYSDNPGAIYEAMLADERFRDYKFIWWFGDDRINNIWWYLRDIVLVDEHFVHLFSICGESYSTRKRQQIFSSFPVKYLYGGVLCTREKRGKEIVAAYQMNTRIATAKLFKGKNINVAPAVLICGCRYSARNKNCQEPAHSDIVLGYLTTIAYTVSQMKHIDRLFSKKMLEKHHRHEYVEDEYCGQNTDGNEL